MIARPAISVQSSGGRAKSQPPCGAASPADARKPASTTNNASARNTRSLVRRVRRRRRERQHRLPLLQALRPDDVRFVVDVLQDDRKRAIILPGHRSVAEEM